MPEAGSGRGRPRRVVSGRRLGIGVVAGSVAAVASGFLVGWVAAPAVFWLVAAAVWLVLTWVAVWPMDAEETARWSTREDPTVATTHLILVIASVASLGGVALLLAATGQEARVAAGLLGVGSVAASWTVVHTVFTLGYAADYYRGRPGGIDFNQRQPPAYTDFAYLGFTMGMTYQVSDTSITDRRIRRTALQHALLSYFLGAVVLAITINAVVTIAG